MVKKSDEQLYKEIVEEVKKIIIFDEFSGVNELISHLDKLVKKKNYTQNNPRLYNEYRKLITKLDWVALPLLRKEEIFGLFNDHFQAALEMEYFDLVDKFKSVLLGIIMHEDRDIFKSKIKHILEKNQATITSSKITNGQPPTVENWIKSYTSELGTGIVETVKLYQYFTQNKDFNNLSETEKEKLKIFFEFYERLKFSSLTAIGIEESVPFNTPEFKGYISDGRLIRESRLDPRFQKILNIVSGVGEDAQISELEEEEKRYKEGSLERKFFEEQIDKEKEVKELRVIADNYKEGSLERKAIEEEIEKLEVTHRRFHRR